MTATPFFTSDLHFDHKNILAYQPATRGHAWDVDTMNQMIIAGINSRCQPSDVLYILGDIYFGKSDQRLESLLDQINTRNIHLILGNHDRHLSKEIKSRFVSVSNYKEIKVDGHHICLMHYPIESWNRSHHGSYHLHGHTHSDNTDQIPRRFDVGIDSRFDFKPWSWEELHHILSQED